MAVKVQRPGLAAAISLDMCVLRQLLGAARQLAGVRQDVRLLADELCRGLLQELDYKQVCVAVGGRGRGRGGVG